MRARIRTHRLRANRVDVLPVVHRPLLVDRCRFDSCSGLNGRDLLGRRGGLRDRLLSCGRRRGSSSCLLLSLGAAALLLGALALRREALFLGPLARGRGLGLGAGTRLLLLRAPALCLAPLGCLCLLGARVAGGRGAHGAACTRAAKHGGEATDAALQRAVTETVGCERSEIALSTSGFSASPMLTEARFSKAAGAGSGAAAGMPPEWQLSGWRHSAHWTP
jgi:hypothetical protein